MGKERHNFFKSLPKKFTYQPVNTIKVGNRLIGDNQPAFIIAEVGSNHRGKLENALKFIDLAKEAGADAVKFQHLQAKSIAADTAVYDSWHGNLSQFYRSAELPYEWTQKLMQHARKKNIIFLSTPFDFAAVNVLDKAGIQAFKVASYELTSDPLLIYIAKKKKPIILSTGMAYLEEVAHAVRIIQQAGNDQIILLHCISIYPPRSFTDLNLKAIVTLREAFKLPVGYSDHSQPPYVAAAVTAVALGACVIEKHITTSRKGGSNDDPNSLEINEFKRMVKEIRLAEQTLKASGIKQPVCYPNHQNDEVYDRWARRSIYAATNIKKGEKLTAEKLTILRPWGGIEPQFFNLLIGKRLKKTVRAREPITWNALI